MGFQKFITASRTIEELQESLADKCATIESLNKEIQMLKADYATFQAQTEASKAVMEEVWACSPSYIMCSMFH